VNWHIHSFATLPSTQEWLRLRATELPEGSVVVAESQSAGHGRLGRPWFSPPGGLYVSLLLKPVKLLPDLPFLLVWATLMVLERYTDFPLDIKRPNDIYSQGRKLAGVLADARVEGEHPQYYVCGIGINLNPVAFPEEIPAVALRQLAPAGADPADLLPKLLQQLQDGYTLLTTRAESFRDRFVSDLGERWVLGAASEQSMRAKEWLYGNQY
jgi:BirA family biotin operon repressor/biotin-[acetyl-CoA-carboxylase] ligase